MMSILPFLLMFCEVDHKDICSSMLVERAAKAKRHNTMIQDQN